MEGVVKAEYMRYKDEEESVVGFLEQKVDYLVEDMKEEEEKKKRDYYTMMKKKYDEEDGNLDFVDECMRDDSDDEDLGVKEYVVTDKGM